MNDPQKILNTSQTALINELVETYGIEPEDVTFFPDDPKPFLSYEATCAVANQLTDIRDIDIKPVEPAFADSLSLKCTLTLADGKTRSAVGVVNLNERIGDTPMNSQQIYQTASSRAIRNALRTAGIDLIKLHEHLANGTVPSSAVSGDAARESLIRQVHALGQEAGLIVTYTDGVKEKTGWRAFLQRRYGLDSTQHFSKEALADLAAVLRSIVGPQTKKAA